MISFLVIHTCVTLSYIAGINIFLDGFVPTENLRFRQTSLSFKVRRTLWEAYTESQQERGRRWERDRGADREMRKRAR